MTYRPAFVVLLLLISLSSAHAQTACGSMPDIFERLECEKALETKRLELEQIQGKREELAATRGGGPIERRGFPTLRRIYGRPGALVASFDADGGRIEASVGDTVAGWRVERIDGAASVTLAAGREKRTLTLGAGSPRITAPDMPEQQPVLPPGITVPTPAGGNSP